MDDMAERASLSAKVHGLVQGVYFRAFVQRQARALGLTGYARNLPDGVTVDILAEGDRKNLEALAKCLKVGPPEARIDGIEITWAEFRNLFDNFRIRY